VLVEPKSNELEEFEGPLEAVVIVRSIGYATPETVWKVDTTIGICGYGPKDAKFG
jgi:hypothetical protein